MLILQVYLMGIFRLVMMYYATVFQGIVMKHKSKRKLYKWTSDQIVTTAISVTDERLLEWSSYVKCGALSFEPLVDSIHWPVVEVLAVHLHLVGPKSKGEYAAGFGNNYNEKFRTTNNATSYNTSDKRLCGMDGQYFTTIVFVIFVTKEWSGQTNKTVEAILKYTECILLTNC